MGQAQNPNSYPLEHFSSPIQALQTLLENINHQGVVIGGVAASLLGTPRFTADIDVVVLLGFEELPNLLHEAEKQGIITRIPNAVDFAQRSRVLLLRHINSGIDIDLSLGVLPFEIEMVERSNLVMIGDIKIQLPTPEDLIIMKSIARRPKDLIDIQAISASNPDLDQSRIRYWIEQFGEALDMPNLWEEISVLL